MKKATASVKKPVAAKPRPSPNPAAKPAAKAASAKPAPKAATPPKSVPPKGSPSKPTPGKPVPKSAPVKAPAKPEAVKTKVVEAVKGKVDPAALDPKKSGRKGITIVTPKPAKKARPRPAMPSVPGLGASLLSPGRRKPLIPSGPSAPAARGELGSDGDISKRKSPFGKRELDRYRQILLEKRRELFGDITTLEREALMSESGSLSSLPQHTAEQGTEAFDQSLSLDLAAADRQLIKEIDAALQRIEDGTFGACELTGKPISEDRLAELPWARYSIEAARERERHGRRV